MALMESMYGNLTSLTGMMLLFWGEANLRSEHCFSSHGVRHRKYSGALLIGEVTDDQTLGY